MLYEGVSAGLSEIFNMAPQTVKNMLGSLELVNKRQGWPIYNLAEAASRLATPTEEQLMRYIKRMPANKLPVHLQKEFWDALRSRQLYEENARDLYGTEACRLSSTYYARYAVFKRRGGCSRPRNRAYAQAARYNQGLIDDLLEDVSKKLSQEDIFLTTKTTTELTRTRTTRKAFGS